MRLCRILGAAWVGLAAEAGVMFCVVIPGIVAACSLAAAGAEPERPGLVFYASFDRATAAADFARGEARPAAGGGGLPAFVPGLKGTGVLMEAGKRLEYPIPGNFDSGRGTFSCWVKPLNWSGQDKKFRHVLAATTGNEYTMLVYLYPVGDEAVLSYIHVASQTGPEATWRAGAPVDIFGRGRWTHVATTWDSKAVRLYANGRRVGEGIVGTPLAKVRGGTFSLCPVEFWKAAPWSDPNERTVCDEVRIFDRVLADDEILDLYAQDVPGGVGRLVPTLVVEMTPRYARKEIGLAVRAAHVSAGVRRRIEREAVLELRVRDPAGEICFSYSGPLGQGLFEARLPEWRDGQYTAEGVLSLAGRSLRGQGVLSKPPTPWLPAKTDWRADRVLAPWTPLARRGETIRFWNGEARFAGPLPEQITSRGRPLLAGPIRLVAGQPLVAEKLRVVEDKPFRVAFAGQGRLGDLAVSFQTLMEFDGLIRCDLTLTPPDGGARLPSLTLEIPLAAEVAQFYRNPACQPWDGRSLVEPAFLPYAWLGNDERGLSWFMESDANWRVGKGQPAMTIRREGQTVLVRLQIASEPTTVRRPLSYTFGLEATPVRPLSPRLYGWRLGAGAPLAGMNAFVYGWGPQISNLNGRLIASNPAEQRKLVDGWRAKGQETLSYTCTQCTANISPEYAVFGEEWNLPYGDAFSGYKRSADLAPYSMVPVCPRSSFADFLVWCVKENVGNDWGGGIYTDIDGAIPCDNAAHGCGYTDAFGRSGRTWPLYAHRGLSRRIYAACHDAGKFYFAHQHSRWYAPFNAFNDGWCPGEQYSMAVMGKPAFYMDGISEAVWRSEFYSPTTGVSTFLLPELGRLGGPQEMSDRGPSECCMAAALVYGVPIWAGQINEQVVTEVWKAQQAFGVEGAEFVPFWKQHRIVCSDPTLRVSLWQRPTGCLVAVANFGDAAKTVELRSAPPGARVAFEPVWQAREFTASDGAARLTIPAKRGALLKATSLR
jgi:hypothetical protein